MQLSDIKEKILKAPHKLSGDLENGEWAKRVLRCDATEELLVVTLDSSDVSLENRLELEDSLTDLLRASQAKIELVFKKSKPSTKRRVPEVQHEKTGAFGLNLNRIAIPHVKNVICVASGKGGVGKSTISANLALSLRKQGRQVGIVDADLYGPSQAKIFGVEDQTLHVRDGKIDPIDTQGIKCLSFASVQSGDVPLIWRGPMISKALTQFFYQTNWGELDYLIVDLPPGTGDIQMTLVEKLPIRGAVIVSSPQDLALIDAAKAVQMFRKLDIPILGLIENMSVFICENCDHPNHIFGEQGAQEFAKKYEIPFLCDVPLRAKLRALCDAGDLTSISSDETLGRPFHSAALQIDGKVFP